jgi:ADP-ribose pyrophosphatase YjhB (NUDIX family)
MDQKIKVRIRLVIIKNEKLLAYYDSMDDYYFYIGGKLEYGETLEEGISREIVEELGEDVKFTLKKILYIRDFILKDKNEHSLELFVLGSINKFKEIEGKPDPEYGGKKWPTWLDINKLPNNLYPRPLSKKLLDDYKKGFPNAGEYIGRMDSKGSKFS